MLGGTRSGKSAVAEHLAGLTGAPIVYLATGRASDNDLAERIAAHRARRPDTWTTVEAGPELTRALVARPDGTVLVDSLGSWVAAHDDLEVAVAPLLAALTTRRGDTVVVSEEVGLAVHPPTELGRRFVDALGDLNRAVADVADRVLLVVAGRVIPLHRVQE